MIGSEHHYNPIEKECLALVLAIQKMRQYLMRKHIQVISRVNPLRLLMTSPSSLNYRPTKWAILLSQYEMQFMPQKVIQGQAVADFLANHPVSETSKLYDNLLDKIAEINLINVSSEEQVRKLSFDRASRMILREISSHV